MDTVRAKRIAEELRDRFVGGWKVANYAGNGASAVVVAAERAGQHLALKLIDPELIERFGIEQQLARVHREQELAGHTEPHLVQIFDGGYCEETSYLYIAMEYCALPQLIKLISKFPRDRVGVIIQQLAGAAKFLETRGIAHRDIKPDNIVITPDCRNATLLDLGVIRPLTGADANDAGTGEAFLGTTRYSPPEYVMREEEDSCVGWRSVTFYQLGAVLHDMIMRHRLFGNVEAPPARLINAVRYTRPVIDAEGVPPHLLALARNCLQKDWRLRVELVRWEHFTEVPAPAQGGEVKERIRRRISLGAAVSEAGPVSRPAPGPPPRRLLEHIGGLIASMVREVCLQSGTFPPLDIRHSSVENERHVCIRTGPSKMYALPVTLEIRISVSPLDAEGLVLRLRGVAGIDAVPATIEQGAWQLVYSGDVSAPALRERLDDFLHLALDAAHNAGGAVASPLLRLPLPE